MKFKTEITQLKIDVEEIQEEIADLQQKVKELIHIVVTLKRREKNDT